MIETRERAGLASRTRMAPKSTRHMNAWRFTQRGLHAPRIAAAKVSGLLSAEEIELDHNLSQGDPPACAARRQGDPRRAPETLFEELRDHVARQLALYGSSTKGRLRDAVLAGYALARIEDRDFDRKRRFVRKRARGLETLHSLRHRRRCCGRLDVRHALARSTRYGGLMIDTRRIHRANEKARAIAICDMSPPVQARARVPLLLVYCLRDVFPGLRSFALTHRLVDVSGRFDKDAPRREIECVPDQMGGTATNHDSMLRDFAAQDLPSVVCRTAVIFLGDKRNNRADPHTDVMHSSHKRARCMFCSKPKARSFWNLGHSESPRNAPFRQAVWACNTLTRLEPSVDGLLRSTGGSR